MEIMEQSAIRLSFIMQKFRKELSMGQNNFGIGLIAFLEKIKSKKMIKLGIKALGDLYVKLIGNLDMSKTRKHIKNQLKRLNNMTFKITPTMNKKGVQNATKQTLKNVQKVANNNKVKIPYSFDMDKQKMKNQLKVFASENSKLFSSKEMTAKYNQLVNLSNVAKSKSELNALRKQLSAFRTELIATNKAGMTWSDKFKASIAHFAQYFSGASFIYVVTNQIRNAWTEAKTLDDSLVNLQKVTAEIEDRDSLYKYFDKALNKAQELNVKVGSLIDAITEFKKLGWSLEDAELGGEWATKLSNVGDVDIETAIGSIKTAVASFDEIGGYGNDQMDKKLEAYVDLINNMSNKYSIDVEGLAESIRLSAGTLTEAHVSIEEAATMFATANKYYNDPSYLGNTAKIGSLRIRATSGDTKAIEELQEMGEEIDNLATASSTLREKLLALTGVDIMEDEHTFKSYYDQLYEIAQVMDTLDDTSRANVLETLFGKSRSAGGAAILSGMKESSDAYQDAINSAGSATQEYETWMQSADAATQRFSNTLTETYQTFINGNTVRDIANLGSVVLEFANTWGIVEGTVKGFLALKIGTFLTNGGMALLTATKQVEQYGKALQLVNNIPNGYLSQRYTTLKSIAQATSSLTTAQLKNVLSSQQLSQQDHIRILQMQGMTKEMALQKLAEINLTQATNAQTTANVAQTASTFSLKSALTGLGATIKSVFLSNPVGIALMAISIGVSAVTSAISNHNQKVEEMRQKAKETAEEANTLGDEIAELSNKYIALSEAVKTDESVKEELMTTQAELLKRLGFEGESIDTLIEKYGSLSNAIRQASIDSLKNKQIDLIAGVDATREELLDVGADGFWGGNNIINATGDDAVKAFKELEKAGVVDSSSFGTGGGSLVLIGDDTTTDGILENYERLEKALVTLRDSNLFTAEELSDNSLYQAIYGRYNEMKETVDAYKNSIQNLNENLAQQTTLSFLQGNEIPKTEKEFESFKNELVDTAVASKQFIGTEKEITDAINNYLSAVPEFEGFYSIPLENELDKVDAVLSQDFEELNSNINTTFDSIQKSYDALQEFKDAMASGMTESALNGVADLSDELKAMVAEFYAGTVSVDELFQALTDHYNTDLENYGKAIIAKNELSEDFYNNIGLADADFVNSMKDNYGIDISNCKNYAEAKLKIEQELSKKCGELWTKYYNAQLGTMTSEYESLKKRYEYLQDPKIMGNAPKYYVDQVYSEWQAVQDMMNGYQSAIDALNKVVYDGLDATFDGVSGGFSISSSKETIETFNWIKVAVERVQRTISNLGDIVGSTYKKWSTRNNALAQEIYAINDEIALQQKAYDKYMSLAYSVGLSNYYKNLVQNGAIQIDTIKSDSLKEQIKQYQEFYEQALECQDAITELRDELVNLAETKFDNYVSEYENQLSMIEQQANMINQSMDNMESKGYMVSAVYYDALIDAEQTTLIKLHEKYNTLNSTLSEFVKNGTIEQYSEKWCEMQLEIDGVKEAILESEGAVIEFNNALRDLEWDVFDKIQNSMSQIPIESDFLIDIMSDEDMHDDKGQLTNLGQATLGLHAINYNAYMIQADELAKELLELNKEIADDPNNQTLLERREELLKLQRRMIKSVEDELQSIKDLYSNGYDKLLDSMSKIIDKRKSMLSQIKDAYSYQKSIEEQTAEVSKYQKIIDSLQGMKDTEQGKSLLQKYEVSLREARDNLESTQYEQYMQDQSALLDSLFDQTSEWINTRLDDLNGIVQSAIDSTNANAENIKATLEAETDEVGIKLSDEMSKILTSNDGMKAVVNMYADNFGTQITTVNSTLLAIKSVIEEMANTSDTTASKEVSSSVNPSNSSSVPIVSTPIVSIPANSGSSSNGGVSGWESALVYSEYVGNNSKLNTSTSIVDLLKSHDYSSEFSDRANLYRAINGSGVYTGSASQNRFLINFLKSQGFAKGGTIGSLIKSTGEDGFVLARTGEEILSLDKIKELGFTFEKMKPIVDTMKYLPNLTNNTSNVTNAPNITVDMSGMQVVANDPDQFAKQVAHSMQNYKFVKQIMNDETLGNALGRNTLMSRTRI